MARHCCVCECHSTARGNQRVALHRGRYFRAYDFAQAAKLYEGVDVTDPVEAAVSCESCRKSHCPALRTRVIWGPLPAALTTPPEPAQFCAGEGDE